ncbi:hypothetical protein KZQ38_23615 [Saccharothrix sp. SC076]|nr:hypothetical protein [Saccharothrix obliqua]
MGRTAPSRRAILAAVAIAPLAAAACTTTPPPAPAPDELEEMLRAARADAALATAVGAQETAAARTEHAQRLKAEVDRATPKVPGETTSAQPEPTPTTPANPTREALVTALQTAQKQAADLAIKVPTHRAGLVASVSAGCASLVEALV